jgi:hypothetical protein
MFEEVGVDSLELEQARIQGQGGWRAIKHPTAELHAYSSDHGGTFIYKLQSSTGTRQSPRSNSSSIEINAPEKPSFI